jgi:hypothetical protein
MSATFSSTNTEMDLAYGDGEVWGIDGKDNIYLDSA